MTHEVYIVRLDGDVLYVGEGVKGRHQHVNSGVSNVYGLNSLHFRGKEMDVEVIECDSKEEADELETELVNDLKPAFNIHKNWIDPYVKELRSCFKECRDFNVTDGNYHVVFLWSVMKFGSSRLNHNDIARALNREGTLKALYYIKEHPVEYADLEHKGEGVFEVVGFKVTPKELRKILRREIGRSRRKQKRTPSNGN